MVSPGGLIEYGWNEVCVNGKTSICCCLCGKEWDKSIIHCYGGAADKEMLILQECIKRNVGTEISDIQCPGCTGLCECMDEGSKCSIYRHICTRKKGKTVYFSWVARSGVDSPSNKKFPYNYISIII